MVNGDEVGLPVSYLHAVEHVRSDVTLVYLGVLSADWYVRQLHARYPDLDLPFTRYDGTSVTMKTFLDANRGRRMFLVGKELDDSWKQSYGFYGHGLALEVAERDKRISLASYAAENETLLARTRPPALSEIKPITFERTILQHYALAYVRVGRQYETTKQYAGARDWYGRALAVYPGLDQARDALARLPQ